VEEQELDLVAQGQRVPETPEPLPQRIFATTVVTGKSSGGTRASRHEVNKVTDQMSDDESEGQVKASTNFSLSGNNNPDQVGKPTIWSDDKDLDQAGGYTDDGDEESDDGGNLFRQSYEGCSGTGECLFRKQAREILAILHEDYGAYKHWSLGDLVSWLKDGMGPDKAREQYIFLMSADDKQMTH
jgi:hypothetical protein